MKLGPIVVASLLALGVLASRPEPTQSATRFRDVADDVFYMYMPIAWRDSDGDLYRYGDFGGMTAALPYLDGLGATAIWMTPIFPSPAYHGYQHGEASQINPWFGNEAQFLSFVNAAHAESIKVFIDLVAYGISQNTVYFQDSFHNNASPYTTWLAYNDAGSGNSSYLGGVYTTWSGASVGFIHWNLDNANPTNLVTGWCKHWLDPDGNGNPVDGIDGYRLDHVSSNDPVEGAWGYDIGWWQNWKAALQTVSPDVYTFAEQSDWGSHGQDLLPAHDATFTKPFEFAVRSALTSGNASGLYSEMQNTVNSLPAGKSYLCILGDHDVDRLMSAIGNNPNRAKAAAAIQMTQPFPPVIYFGDELGMRGVKANYGSDANDIPFREPFKWNAVAGPPMSNYFAQNAQAFTNRVELDNDGRSVQEQQGNSTSLLETYRRLIAFRRAHVALRRGSYTGVPNSSTNVWAFSRVAPQESLLVLVNLSASSRTPALNLSAFTIDGGQTAVRDLLTGETFPNLTTANQASYSLSIPGNGYRILSARVAPTPPPPARADGAAITGDFAGKLVATQDNATGLGDNINELDQLFVSAGPNELALGLTGNLGTDGTGLVLFFDTVAGGQNPLQTASFPEPPSGLPQISGMQFDPGFAPDVALFVNGFGGNLYIDHYTLASGGGGTKRYVGAGSLNSGNGTLTGGSNTNALELAFDVGNTAGVTAASAAGAATATRGLEAFIRYPDLLLSGPGASIKVMAMLLQPDGFVGNQFLPGLGGGRANLGYVPIDLGTIPGSQYATLSTVVGVDAVAPPDRLALAAAPNPFSRETVLRFELARDEQVRIEVLDLGGRRVADLGRWSPGAGTHTRRWDGRDAHGNPVSPGVYFARLTTPGGSRTARVLRIR